MNKKIFIHHSKLLLFIVVYVIYLLLLPPLIHAHLPGQEPYFKINGKLSQLYPVLLIPSSNKFQLPQDIAPATYTIGEELSFELIKDKLPFSEETLRLSEFYWDYGDSTKGTGLENTHTYNKIGSYVLKIHADYNTVNPINDDDLQLLQSVLINIVKNNKTPLPTLEIKINDQVQNTKDTLKIDITKENTYEAKIKNADQKTTEFIWDLSDGTSKKGAKITYKNDQNFLIINPVVHAVTKDGFIIDRDIVIENDKSSNKSNIFIPLILINGIGLIVLAVIIVISKKKASLKNEKK